MCARFVSKLSSKSKDDHRSVLIRDISIVILRHICISTAIIDPLYVYVHLFSRLRIIASVKDLRP